MRNHSLGAIYAWLCESLPEPQEAWEMLSEVTVWRPKDLISQPDVCLSPSSITMLESWVCRRQEGEPLAYILGKRHFRQVVLSVNESVLIPRPDTECLVDWVLSQYRAKDPIRVLDLGTGSGAIILSIAEERPRWQCVATDLSEAALAVAKHNANLLQLHQVAFYQGKWLSALTNVENMPFDVIISNPPYLSIDDPHLQQGDLRFEPQTALVAAAEGFADFEAILLDAPHWMHSESTLVLEHGYTQQQALIEKLSGLGYRMIQAHRDLAYQPRFVTAKRFI